MNRNTTEATTTNVDNNTTYVWNITINLTTATALIGEIMDFLQLFMPVTIAKRIISSLLLIVGAPRKLIVDLGISCQKSLCTYNKIINNGKIQELFFIKKGSGRPPFYEGVEDKDGKKKNLVEVIQQLIDTANCYCYKDVIKLLHDKLGLKPSLSGIRYTLKKWGYKWLKCGSLPAKADVDLQRQFYDNTLHPAMIDSKAGKCHLFFMDAAHFVFGCDFLGKIHTRTRRYIKTHCGRSRYNVLGAINFLTKEVLTVTNDAYITSTEIVEILKKMHEKYAKSGLPIKIILDNARYQKCKYVQEAASALNISLIYLPSYSPNLNVIERLWKYVKSDIRSNIMKIADFAAFKKHIDNILSESSTTRLKDIGKLVGEKVQLFDNVTIAA